jgi:parallel beta-helix repeat protein
MKGTSKPVVVTDVDAIGTAIRFDIAALSGYSTSLHTPASGKRTRLKLISLEHSADVTIGYAFGATGIVNYLRITKGVYVSNLIGCNVQGANAEGIYLWSSGATNVKGYIIYEDVDV